MSKEGRQFLRRNQKWHRWLKKGRQVFQEKIEGWHPQLPHRVSPTLVTPLILILYDWRDDWELDYLAKFNASCHLATDGLTLYIVCISLTFAWWTELIAYSPTLQYIQKTEKKLEKMTIAMHCNLKAARRRFISRSLL